MHLADVCTNSPSPSLSLWFMYILFFFLQNQHTTRVSRNFVYLRQLIWTAISHVPIPVAYTCGCLKVRRHCMWLKHSLILRIFLFNAFINASRLQHAFSLSVILIVSFVVWISHLKVHQHITRLSASFTRIFHHSEALTGGVVILSSTIIMAVIQWMKVVLVVFNESNYCWKGKREVTSRTVLTVPNFESEVLRPTYTYPGYSVNNSV